MAMPTEATVSTALKAIVSTVLKARKVAKNRKSSIVKPSDYKRKGWAYRLIWNGTKTKTSGGLRVADLTSSKRGRIVSRRKSAAGANTFVRNNLDLWMTSFMEARRTCAINGFVCPRRQGGLESQRELYKKTLDGFVAKNVERLNKKLQSPNIKELLLRTAADAAPTADVAPTESQEVKVQLEEVKVESGTPVKPSLESLDSPGFFQ